MRDRARTKPARRPRRAGRWIALAVASCALAALTASACGNGAATSSGGGGGGNDPNCPAYEVPSGTNLMTPVVSLKTDVMGVFNANCGSSTCHGTTAGAEGGLFLGAETAMKADASMVRSGLVGHMGTELSTMPFVTPGDPTKSYLMHKMDGDQCIFNVHCAGSSCSAAMPSGLGHVLPVQTRDTIRRWIAQGAQDN